MTTKDHDGNGTSRSIGSKHAPPAGVPASSTIEPTFAASPIEVRYLHCDDMVPNYTRQNAPNLTVGASNRLGLGGLLANRETNPRRRVPRLLPPSSGGRTNTTRIL